MVIVSVANTRNTSTRPMSAAEFVAVGNEHVVDELWDEAIEAYTSALAIESSAATLTKRALCHASVDAIHDALQDVHDALLLEPNNRRALERK